MTEENKNAPLSKRELRAQKAAKKKEERNMLTRTLKFMFATAAKEKPVLFFLYFIRIVSNIAQKAVLVLLPKFLIDELMLAIRENDPAGHLGNIILYAALACITEFLATMANSLAAHYKSVYSEWFNERFLVMLADKSMRMDFEQTEDPAVLDCQARAKEGISWYSGGVVGILDYVFGLVLNITVLFGVGVIIFLTCPLLLPVQLISLLLIGYFNAKNNQLEVDSYSKLAKLNRVFGYYLFQLPSFEYGKEIRLYDSERMMNGRAKEASNDMMDVWKAQADKQRMFVWGMDLTNAARDGFSYFYIGYLAVKRVISVGDFAMCVSSASELYQGMYGLVRNWQEVVKRCNYAYRFLQFLDYPETLQKGERKVSGQEHVITFEHVGFRYPRSENYVLRDINLTIHPGEHLSIVGLNGAGKTTFIKLLCRLYDVTEGSIKIDGNDIRDYSEEEYRKLFSVVFQDFWLFAFSLKENISFDEKTPDAEIERVLKLSGLWDDAQKLPEGADTILYKSFDEKGTELSGGQKQKTAISRALYRDAPVVILDEPTAALDPVAEYDIYRQFDTLVGGKTAIYISHRLSSCKFCDKIAVFAENTIKEYGTHEELVCRENGIYAEMFAAQAQYYIGREGTPA